MTGYTGVDMGYTGVGIGDVVVMQWGYSGT